MSAKANNDKKKVGIYICHCGGNISDVVDVHKAAEVLNENEEVTVARTNMFMCSSLGQEMIEKDIKELGIERVIVASCTPSLHRETFRRCLVRANANPYLLEQVNIREQVSWTHHGDHEGATNKAIHLIQAGVQRSVQLEALEPIRVPTTKRAVVIGGGVAGLRAARDISKHDIPVTIIEKSFFVGGRMAQLGDVFPTGDRATDLLKRLLNEVVNDENIEILTGANITKAGGYIGQFDIEVEITPRGVSGHLNDTYKTIQNCPVTVEDEFEYGLETRKAFFEPHTGNWPDIPAIDWENCTKCGKCVPGNETQIQLEPDASNKEKIKISAGSIVVATGFQPYEPLDEEYAWNQSPYVVTLPQFVRKLEVMRDHKGGNLIWRNREIKRIAFIHCVGSRQIQGIHKPGRDGKINEYCSRVCCTATMQAITEVQKRYPSIKIIDLFQDIRTYGNGHEDYYLDASRNGALFIRYNGDEPPSVDLLDGNDAFPLKVTVNDTLSGGEEIDVSIDLVVLAVAMKPRDISNIIEELNLPVSVDGFLLEAHPKLRPVEVASGGIFLAGTSQYPMDITESTAAASASAAKVSTILSGDYTELDPYVAVVDEKICDGTGACVEECPFTGAIRLEEKKTKKGVVRHAVVTPAFCKGCGACVAVCPNNAIDVQGFRLKQLEGMIDGLVYDWNASASNADKEEVHK